MKKGWNKLHLIALCMALVLMVGTVAFAAGDGKAISQEEIDGIVNTTTDQSQIAETSPFIQACNAVRDSVVGINNYRVQRNSYYDYYGFGRYRDRSDEENRDVLYGKGSGVVVSPYGHILTNYHVIENASRVTVTIADSDQEYDAEVITYSEDEDVAVLLVRDLPVPAVQLGDSDQLQVGEWAIVIGNPLSDLFARTVTVGVVSAIDRAITDTSYDRFGRRTNITNSMIQVDAAINSGNSGGGMFNTLGQLMGIPARKYSSNSLFSTASIENIGMCIPINVAKPYIRTALEKYNATDTAVTAGTNGTDSSAPAAAGDKAMLGVTIFTMSVTDILPNGAIVSQVTPGSNAERGGIQVGDVIVEVNGTRISSSTDLRSYIQSCNDNDTLTVTVYRAPGMDQAIGENGRVDLSGVEKEYSEDFYKTLTVVLLNDKAA